MQIAPTRWAAIAKPHGTWTVDRHASGSHRDRVALRWLSKEGARRDFTYANLRDQTSRFANALKSLGVGRAIRSPPRTMDSGALHLRTRDLTLTLLNKIACTVNR
jgi:long-subunit acyl-CoA synthetase (AMP-forming)